MSTENAVLMQNARESLRGKWGLAIGTFLVYIVISSSLQFIPFLGAAASLLISGPFALGLAKFALSISRNEDTRLEHIFSGFNHFGTALASYLLVTIFTLLWMLLLIVPGIIAAFSYSMTFFIINDEPTIGAMEAIDKSKKMMDGFKMKYFRMMLRFVGWSLLCILTLGIGFLWLIPYMQVSMAKFYEDVKANSTLSATI
jgi:uncharacterized membrane protein